MCCWLPVPVAYPSYGEDLITETKTRSRSKVGHGPSFQPTFIPASWFTH